MKKILSAIAGVIVLSAPISSVGFAVAGPQIKIPWYQVDKSTPVKPIHWTPIYWKEDSDFSIFNHGYYANTFYQDFNVHEAQHPANVDININIPDLRWSNDELISDILFKLNKRYEEYVNLFYQHLYYIFNSFNSKIQFYNPQNDGENVYNDFSINTLNALGLMPESGQWKTFNLKLVNLKNNTSFEFSLNLCNFPNDMDEMTFQNLPSTYKYKHVPNTGDSGINYINSYINNAESGNPDRVLNINNIQQPDEYGNLETVASFDTADQIDFFLNPFTYHYKYHIWETDPAKGYHIDLSGSHTDTFKIGDLRISSSEQLEKDENVCWNYDEPYGPGLINDGEEIVDNDPDAFLSIGLWNSECFDENNNELLIMGQGGAKESYQAYKDLGHQNYSWRFQYYGLSLTTSFNDVFSLDSVSPYQLLDNSITDYHNFLNITDNTITRDDIDMYGYKSDLINNYYTYAVKK